MERACTRPCSPKYKKPSTLLGGLELDVAEDEEEDPVTAAEGGWEDLTSPVPEPALEFGAFANRSPRDKKPAGLRIVHTESSESVGGEVVPEPAMEFAVLSARTASEKKLATLALAISSVVEYDDDEGMQEVPEGQSLRAFQADLLSDSK